MYVSKGCYKDEDNSQVDNLFGDCCSSENGCKSSAIMLSECPTDGRGRAIDNDKKDFKSDLPQYRHLDRTIQSCFELAKKRGHTIFAVENGHECFTQAGGYNSDGYHYNKYGQSDQCKNGRGDNWAMNVYEIGIRTFCSVCLILFLSKM